MTDGAATECAVMVFFAARFTRNFGASALGALLALKRAALLKARGLQPGVQASHSPPES